MWGMYSLRVLESMIVPPQGKNAAYFGSAGYAQLAKTRKSSSAPVGTDSVLGAVQQVANIGAVPPDKKQTDGGAQDYVGRLRDEPPEIQRRQDRSGQR